MPLNLDWPKDKLTIYLLDDGSCPEFQAFAQEVGIRYIARENTILLRVISIMP